MKGIVLAGGRGTRLRPFTYIIKKELLPVYDKPLIFYPLDTLRKSGITEVVVVVDPKSVGAFHDIIGEGKELGMKIAYALQNEPLGMAHALYSARHLVGRGESLAVINGDNVFEESFTKEIGLFIHVAQVIITQVPDPERSGVVSFKGKEILRIEEKPLHPASNWIATGFYLYDPEVFSIIEGLKPSSRGEYEITDVNNVYVKEKNMGYIKTKGKWFDAGTFSSLLEASLFIARKKNGKTFGNT
ncbi:MAG: sugar nucleotidyltransferase [Candidatus Portnoybacteria bacterium]|nr:sugar nucleotidyltransferase [Candidatus Portnoybacteria bacterium]